MQAQQPFASPLLGLGEIMGPRDGRDQVIGQLGESDMVGLQWGLHRCAVFASMLFPRIGSFVEGRQPQLGAGRSLEHPRFLEVH